MGKKKIYAKKSTAKNKAPSGASVYKVKGGWSVSRKKRRRRRRKRKR